MQASGGRPRVTGHGVADRERGGRFRRWAYLPSLLCLLLLVPAARAAPAAPGRFALVLGEAAYQSLPQEPGCAVSAQVIAGRLRALGFDVVARTDASNGEMSAALIDLAHHAGSAAHPTVAIYFCGHTVGFEGRIFLLPVGAALDRPSDALAEGVPAQSLLDIADRGTRAGLTVFDAYDVSPAQPAAPAAWARFLGGRTLSPGRVVFAASETAAVTTATPLAQALSASLTKPPVDLDPMTAAIRTALAGSGVAFAASGKGGGATLVAEAVAPPPAPKIGPPKPAATPSPTPPPAAAAATPALSLPAEQQYSVLDRRRVQAALRLLGYYEGVVDGIFGPQTRAAIRHYQHDVGVPETGTLTPAEANRLVAGLPRAGR
jgi:hypothetical protein